MVLTREKLEELNNRMLGKGAPIVDDGVGYNQYHYGKMAGIAYKENLTESDCYSIAVVLMTYSKTQLVDFAEDIKDTIEFYQKKVKEVKVVDYSRNSVKLSWAFNQQVSNFIKNSLDRENFRWTKPDGNWVLDIKWSAIGGLLEKFTAEGYMTTQVTMIRDNLDSLLPEKESEKTAEKIIIGVSRPSTTIDTLVVEFPYNKDIVNACNTVPCMFFNKSSKTWETYIEYSYKLYEALVALKMNLDLTQLKPWADMVKDWGKSYELVDLKNYTLKFTPYNFQPEDAKELLEKKWMINGNEMGCGKTFEQVIVGESIPMKKLVICPPTLRLNWKKEILAVNPNANVNILYSNQPFKVVDGWNIIGYTSLDKFLADLEAEKFQVVMADEAHFVQAVSNGGTPESIRAYGTLRLAATANYVFPITGTPKTNRNKNLFNILRMVRHPLTRGKWAFNNYGKTYCDAQHNGWGWDYNGNSNDENLYEQLQPFMVRHLKKDVLPHLKKQRIMMPLQVDLKEYHYEISQYLQNRSNKNGEDLARLMRARKVLATQKVGESIEFANNLIMEGKKVVIVTCFNDVVKAIEKKFKGNVVKIVGGMSDTQKDQAVTEFQEGDAQVMVMNIIAGGVGITLTRAYNMIVNDFDWVSGNHLQAEDRICRGGQVEEYCNIFYLYADGADMDELMADTLQYKSETINAAVDGGKGDELTFLDLLNKALEKSTGIKKVRKVVRVSDDEEGEGNGVKVSSSKVIETPKKAQVVTTNFSGMTLDELWNMAKELKAECKVYSDEKIQKMRLIMAIKKAM